MNSKFFQSPERDRPRTRVFPAFLPFHGCPVRCIFCAQTLQTGKESRRVCDILTDLDADLQHALNKNTPPFELAFYGGTFTALPPEDQAACLDLAAKYKKFGLVTRVRASTRPDALTSERLRVLRDAGLDMLELGIQSFDDAPLAASSRGYGRKTALAGCALVNDSGLDLGIQLMPGMPGMTPPMFREDIADAVAQHPVAVRLYPCLVLAETALAALYADGRFTPWPLEETVPLLAEAQLAFWRANITVIRIGLAPEDGLDQGGILAGPQHPALGSIVRGLALFRYIEEEIARFGLPVAELTLPRRFQGEFWGHKGERKAAYAAIGIRPESVKWHDKDWCAFRK